MKSITACSKPLLDGIDSNHLVLRALLRQLEQSRDDYKVRDHILAGVGAHPEHCLIVSVRAVGVFDGDLRLANPPESTDGLRLG